MLDSYTASPRQVVITAKAAGLGTVVLWDENGLCQSYPLSVDVDVEGLRKDLNSAFPDQPIQVEGRGSTISLAGIVPSPAAADAAMKLAGIYSKDVADSLHVAAPHIGEYSRLILSIDDCPDDWRDHDPRFVVWCVRRGFDAGGRGEGRSSTACRDPCRFEVNRHENDQSNQVLKEGEDSSQGQSQLASDPIRFR